MTEEEAEAWISQKIWPNGFRCRKCGSEHILSYPQVVRGKPRIKRYCRSCMAAFSVIAHSPLHHTHIPFSAWVMAIQAMYDNPGIRKSTIRRMMGISENGTSLQTACIRIRAFIDTYMEPPEPQEEAKVEKDPNAVSLGRRGGEARAKSLTKQELSEIAKRGAAARWKDK